MLFNPLKAYIESILAFSLVFLYLFLVLLPCFSEHRLKGLEKLFLIDLSHSGNCRTIVNSCSRFDYHMIILLDNMIPAVEKICLSGVFELNSHYLFNHRS